MSLVFNKRLPTSQEVSPPILSFSSILFDTSVDYGGSVTLNSTAVARNPSTNTNAPGTISYRWYKDGVLISGETGPTLTLTNQLSEASYYCEAQYIRTSTSAPVLIHQLHQILQELRLKIMLSSLDNHQTLRL